MGITVYDGMPCWDLSRSDVAAKIVPDLAESWSISETDKKVWTFQLRRGVRFPRRFGIQCRCGRLEPRQACEIPNAPQFDAAQAAQGGLYTGGIASWRKLDDNTVEIITKVVDAVLPCSLASVFMSSPAQYEKSGAGLEASLPSCHSGTGPWKLESFKPARARRSRGAIPIIGTRRAFRNASAWFSCRSRMRTPGPPRSCQVTSTGSRLLPPTYLQRLRQQKMRVPSRTSIRTCGRTCLAFRRGVSVPRPPGAQGRGTWRSTARG